VEKERYDQAAVRHFADARHLARESRYDGAGHLIGFAAECAIKHAVSKIRPNADAPHRHLPELVEAAKKALHGSRHRNVLELFRRADFFGGWTVEGRYHGDGSISKGQYAIWEAHAQRALAAAGLRGGPDV